jgi:hypothetical protein
MHRRGEGAQARHGGVDDIDVDLEADQVRGGVPHRAGGERVEQRAAAESHVDQLHSALGGCQGRPDGNRAGSVSGMPGGHGFLLEQTLAYVGLAL